jgi:hypothetical protein
MINLILIMMSLLGSAQNTKFAETLSTVSNDEAPLFDDDADKHKTVALMTAVAFRESSFILNISSKTNDHCWFQINGRPDLKKDPVACTKAAFKIMRESIKVCPKYPVAYYAEGPQGCKSARAQRISSDRMRLAQRIKIEAEKKIATMEF